MRWIVLGAAAIVAFLYFVPITFVAYRSDAYVRSDFVEVAPAQAAAAPLITRAISALLGSGRNVMRDPRGSAKGDRRGVTRGADLA